MLVLNETRGTTVANSARKAATFLARGRGLMMAPPLPEGGGLVLDPCGSIHMFFMKYPLDILFLDKNESVVFMYKGIKPWRMGRIVRGAKMAIELPEGAIEGSKTEVGDRISFG